MRDYDLLTADLPFGLDDVDAANEAFAAGRRGDARAARSANLWAYAYVLRYMKRKFARERFGGPSDRDVAETRAIGAIKKAWERVEDEGRFASYIAKSCKNALLTHRARRKTTVEADDLSLAPTLDDERHASDGAVVRRDVAAAIADLPPAVRAVAEMRFLGAMDYDAIAQATGHALPTVRTYAHKAMTRLREHPRVRAHFFDDVLPPGALGDSARDGAASDASSDGARASIFSDGRG